MVTKAGSKRTAARRRTAGRSAAIAASIRIRVPAKSPSPSHPPMPESGSDIVPELAVIGVYVTNATWVWLFWSELRVCRGLVGFWRG